jgi:hypothetical protein
VHNHMPAKHTARHPNFRRGWQPDLAVALKPARVRARVEPGVDGRATAEHACADVGDAVLRHERLRGRVGLRRGVRQGERPDEAAGRGERRELAGRAAALEQEHTPATGTRKRRCEGAPRRASSHHNVIVLLHRRHRRCIEQVTCVPRQRPCGNQTHEAKISHCSRGRHPGPIRARRKRVTTVGSRLGGGECWHEDKAYEEVEPR